METSNQEFKASSGYKNPYLKRKFNYEHVRFPPPPFVNKTHILSLFSASTRSKFYVREPVNAKPNWVKVGLTLGTSVFMWIYVSMVLIGSPGAEVTDIYELPLVGPGNQTWVLFKQYMLLTAKPSLQLQVNIHS